MRIIPATKPKAMAVSAYQKAQLSRIIGRPLSLARHAEPEHKLSEPGDIVQAHALGAHCQHPFALESRKETTDDFLGETQKIADITAGHTEVNSTPEKPRVVKSIPGTSTIASHDVKQIEQDLPLGTYPRR